MIDSLTIENSILYLLILNHPSQQNYWNCKPQMTMARIGLVLLEPSKSYNLVIGCNCCDKERAGGGFKA